MIDIGKEKRKKFTLLSTTFLVIGLLILRYPFVILTREIPTLIPNNIARDIFTDGTYLLTAMLLLIEKNRLEQYNINILALIIFISSPIIKPIMFSVTAKYTPFKVLQFSWLQIIVGIILCFIFISSNTKIRKGNFKYHIKWLSLSIITGIVLGLVEGFIYIPFSIRGNIRASFAIFILNFIVQLTNAAICEEPLFRGFIWGYLENKGWNWTRVWLFQAVIFSIAHVYYLPKSPVFFIGTFISALVFGLLVRRSKSIGTSMITHGILNSLGDMITHFSWR